MLAIVSLHLYSVLYSKSPWGTELLYYQVYVLILELSFVHDVAVSKNTTINNGV